MKKRAYLTIDDSPSSSFLDKVYYLKQKKVPAIFFCIGQLMETYPKETIEAIQLGFPIANHSYSHPHFSSIDAAQAKKEILQTDAIIEDLYQQAKVKRTQKWFRFPYGDKGDGQFGRVFKKKGLLEWLRRSNTKQKMAIQQILSTNGYTQPSFPNISYNYMKLNGLLDDIDWHWTFDIMEWATFEKKPTQQLADLPALIQRMKQSTPKDARGTIGTELRWLQSPSEEIILLHDHVETDPIFFPIIDYLVTLPLSLETLV